MVTALATTSADGAPHVIPVSAALLEDGVVWLGLAGRRSALASLRDRPRVAVLVLERGVARTLHGSAEVAGPLPGAGKVVGVRVRVDRAQDHLHPQMALDAGVRWTWTDGEAAARDAAVLDGLRALAARG